MGINIYEIMKNYDNEKDIDSKTHLEETILKEIKDIMKIEFNKLGISVDDNLSIATYKEYKTNYTLNLNPSDGIIYIKFENELFELYIYPNKNIISLDSAGDSSRIGTKDYLPIEDSSLNTIFNSLGQLAIDGIKLPKEDYRENWKIVTRRCIFPR